MGCHLPRWNLHWSPGLRLPPYSKSLSRPLISRNAPMAGGSDYCFGDMVSLVYWIVWYVLLNSLSRYDWCSWKFSHLYDVKQCVMQWLSSWGLENVIGMCGWVLSAISNSVKFRHLGAHCVLQLARDLSGYQVKWQISLWFPLWIGAHYIWQLSDRHIYQSAASRTATAWSL